MASNGCIDEESLQRVCHAQTEICSRLLEAQMTRANCTRVIRIDHSQKFCSKFKVFGSSGEKEQSSSVRMLLLVQNEVGQIVSRGLTRSENHDESASILQSVIPNLDLDSSPPLVCVCDNANQTRVMVDKVFGGTVLTKQDPFHVIQRLTEKLSEQSQRKALSKQLSRAMYDVENKIRAPDAMVERFLSVLTEIQRSSVRVSFPVWENCIAVNVNQIRAGDLFVEENEYLEKGKKIRVVSTNQLEVVHSKLRKLLDRIVSIEVGIRILDIFLLQHNLKTGAKFKRNPSFAEFDFVALCKTAVICRGVIPDSPQLEFIHELLAVKITIAFLHQRLRPGGDSALNRPWERIYGMFNVSTASVEASMLRKRAASSDIRQLLTSVHVNRKLVSQEVFVHQLGLEVEYESTAEFSSNEFSLLEQISKEQLALDQQTYWWRECEVVTTVLYNASVRQLDNPSLKLRKRCFHTIDKYLATIDAKLKAGPTQSSAPSILRLNKDEHGKPNDDVNSEDDECLQKKLFNLLRVKNVVKKRAQVFATCLI